MSHFFPSHLQTIVSVVSVVGPVVLLLLLLGDTPPVLRQLNQAPAFSVANHFARISTQGGMYGRA